MEISLSRRSLIIIGFALAALFAAVVITLTTGGADTAALPDTSASAVPAATAPHSAASTSNAPEAATVAFAQAFYTVDFADYAGWLARLEATSTQDGFAILKRSVAPAVWPTIEQAGTTTPANSVKAEDKGLLAEGVSPTGGPWQIREVQVAIDPAHLWPTMNESTFTTPLMIGQQAGQWRFVSFMTEAQVKQFQETQP